MSDPRSIIASLSGVSTAIRVILERCLEGRELTWQQAVALARTRGRNLQDY